MKMEPKYLLKPIVACILVACSMNILSAKNTQAKFAEMNAKLGVDVEKILRDKLHYENSDISSRVKLFWRRCNFSSQNGTKKDYLLKVNFEAEYWKDNTTIIVAFVKMDSSYKLISLDSGNNKFFNTSPQLVDIDSDSRMEVLIKSDGSGNQSTDVSVEILRFNGTEFVSIFCEHLSEGYTSCPYSTDNKYYFIKNKSNPKLLDIYFTVQTSIDMPSSAIKSYWSDLQKNLTLPKPFRSTYIYHFNGSEYVSNKEVYDYLKFFKAFFIEGGVRFE